MPSLVNLFPKKTGDCPALIYWLLEGVNPISRRISSLIRRFSSSFFAIIHSSFSLNTSSSRLGFSFWTALAVPGANTDLTPNFDKSDLTGSELASSSEAKNRTNGESEDGKNSESEVEEYRVSVGWNYRVGILVVGSKHLDSFHGERKAQQCD